MAQNAITIYRAAQHRLRGLFAEFTASHCPTCPTPCCRQPTWVRPVDVILVEELGYRLPESAGPAGKLLSATLEAKSEDEGAPCEYLGAGGCAFPDDLRPFGCATFICEYMRRDMPPEELAHVEAAVGELEAAYERLMAELQAPI